jgi:hypothetical protein
MNTAYRSAQRAIQAKDYDSAIAIMEAEYLDFVTSVDGGVYLESDINGKFALYNNRQTKLFDVNKSV